MCVRRHVFTARERTDSRLSFRHLPSLEITTVAVLALNMTALSAEVNETKNVSSFSSTSSPVVATSTQAGSPEAFSVRTEFTIV